MMMLFVIMCWVFVDNPETALLIVEILRVWGAAKGGECMGKGVRF